MNLDHQRPKSVLICALGGEGGGVLAEWLVDTATRSGYSAQSTSIPGVAQRTGSTTYYFEIFPVPVAELGGHLPVFSLYPVPGALDVLVSSELLETVRHIGNGMVSPERTLVVSSSSRTLTTAEKLRPGDGRASSEELLKIVQQYSNKAHVFDMSAVAQESATVVSAVLFGAIAASGTLPFSREAFEDTIRHSNTGVEASLRGFARGFEMLRQGRSTKSPLSLVHASAGDLPPGVAQAFPAQTHAMLRAGYTRVHEYQDGAYAELYIRRLTRILEAERSRDPSGEGQYATTSETARYLALWMAFDDIVRVAELKCRASRFVRVRAEVKAEDGDVLRIYDHFKPGIPEFAALLPASLARTLAAWDMRRQRVGKKPLALPLKIGVHTVSGFLSLRFLASLKWLRKRGSRYAQEQSSIEHWLAAVERGARSNWELGNEIALCGRLIKGYGTTNERGKANLLHVIEQLAPGGDTDSSKGRAQAIRAARLAALADEAGRELDKTLLEYGAAPRPVKAQPIMWVKKRRGSPA